MWSSPGRREHNKDHNDSRNAGAHTSTKTFPLGRILHIHRDRHTVQVCRCHTKQADRVAGMVAGNRFGDIGRRSPKALRIVNLAFCIHAWARKACMIGHRMLCRSVYPEKAGRQLHLNKSKAIKSPEPATKTGFRISWCISSVAKSGSSSVLGDYN